MALANLSLGCMARSPTTTTYREDADRLRLMSDYEVTLVNDNSAWRNLPLPFSLPLLPPSVTCLESGVANRIPCSVSEPKPPTYSCYAFPRSLTTFQ